MTRIIKQDSASENPVINQGSNFRLVGDEETKPGIHKSQTLCPGGSENKK